MVQVIYSPLNTWLKLNIWKTFWRHPRQPLKVLCTFNLRPVSRVNNFQLHFSNIFVWLRTNSCPQAGPKDKQNSQKKPSMKYVFENKIFQRNYFIEYILMAASVCLPASKRYGENTCFLIVFYHLTLLVSLFSLNRIWLKWYWV